MSVPLVVLEAATAREAPVLLAPATFALGPGVHALIGTRDDGVGLVLSALAGLTRVRSGTVRVLGGEPTARSVRPAVAYVGREIALPEVLRVGEALAMAARIRGAAADPRAALERLGVTDLLPRRVKTLLPSEARAVALAEALAGGAKVLLLDEPFIDVDPRAAAHLAAALRARAEGVCVVVATASLREAAELADDHLLFERGRFVHRTTALGDLTARGEGLARLRATTLDPRTLLAALAAETAAVSIEAGPGSVTVAGPDVVLLADALARAALRANVEISSLRVEAPARGVATGDGPLAPPRTRPPPTTPTPTPAPPQAPTTPTPSVETAP